MKWSFSLLAFAMVPLVSVGVDFSISWGKPADLGPGGYARVHRLSDGRLMAAYERGGDMIVRFNVDRRIDTWREPQRVAWHFVVTNGSDVVRVNLANAEFSQLETGRILLACNMRPAGKRCDVHPYAIALTASDDGGETWSPLRIIYKGRKCVDGIVRGCYEPFILPLSGSAAQLFYADETPYEEGRHKYQEISMIETSDGGETWRAPRTASYAPKCRDGMPVVLPLGEWRYLAIESNPAKMRLHPQIIRSRVSDNWRNAVGNPSPDRFEPFLSPPDWKNNYGGAPYIAATENFVLLSWQECAGRGDVAGAKTLARVAAAPKTEIRDGRFTTMRGESSPPEGARRSLKMRWNALCPLDGDRFLLVSDCDGRIVIWPGRMVKP